MCRQLVTVTFSEHLIDLGQVSESRHCSLCGSFLSSKLIDRTVPREPSAFSKLKSFLIKNIQKMEK